MSKKSSVPTFVKPHRPFLSHFPNKFETLINRYDISMVNLSEPDFIRRAVKSTGLDDFGIEDFLSPLSILIKSCQEDANLTFAGKLYLKTLIDGILKNRLQVTNDIKQHPEILSHPIRRPLFIVGLPRTGTTLLHNLLSMDPGSRFLRLWEAVTPSPPPSPKTRIWDKRLIKTRCILLLKRYLSPEIFVAKSMNAKSSEECITLLGQSFLSHRMFSIFLNVRQYMDWVKKQDMRPAYKYHHQLLQLLQFRYPADHWVLKAPEHLIHIDSLLAQYPDASLVQTHRDPVKSVPSSCSMLAIFRGSYSDDIDLKEVGQSTVEWMSSAVNQAMDVRKAHDPASFCDVRYQDLVADPIETVHKIYDHFGYTRSTEMDNRMHTWLNRNPGHKKGMHRYSLEQFHLNEEVIYKAFEKYYQHYFRTPHDGAFIEENTRYVTASHGQNCLNSVAVITFQTLPTFENTSPGDAFPGGKDASYWPFGISGLGLMTTSDFLCGDQVRPNADGSVTIVIAPLNMKSDIVNSGLNYMKWGTAFEQKQLHRYIMAREHFKGKIENVELLGRLPEMENVDAAYMDVHRTENWMAEYTPKGFIFTKNEFLQRLNAGEFHQGF